VSCFFAAVTSIRTSATMDKVGELAGLADLMRNKHNMEDLSEMQAKAKAVDAAKEEAIVIPKRHIIRTSKWVAVATCVFVAGIFGLSIYQLVSSVPHSPAIAE
jgi:hypothetical protein